MVSIGLSTGIHGLNHSTTRDMIPVSIREKQPTQTVTTGPKEGRRNAALGYRQNLQGKRPIEEWWQELEDINRELNQQLAGTGNNVVDLRQQNCNPSQPRCSEGYL
ncbi:unnamed protein product [Bursaphelenchus xylophilus]|uniref:(pine wood nematode) hypothetical protein n=1 Tax=Bursaphelenchus xylophilus TaxID=6326 RepID=A0A1I7S1M7_BURXY|nr:unnamed protein product [Bursaphelenchus xylophilus]CAG9081247.1 unnamed protein product [Bursaphelenchus xylophilus]